MVRGARVILCEASELQLGLSAINWRQTAISQFFKPTLRTTVIKKKIDWSDSINKGKPLHTTRLNKKDKTTPLIAVKNRDLKIDQIFTSVESGGRLYWEFKAG